MPLFPSDYVIVAAIQRREAVSLAVASIMLPGRGTWNGAGPAEATRQAGDQGCCGG